jgi:hypothetical protein
VGVTGIFVGEGVAVAVGTEEVGFWVVVDEHEANRKLTDSSRQRTSKKNTDCFDVFFAAEKRITTLLYSKIASNGYACGLPGRFLQPRYH